MTNRQPIPTDALLVAIDIAKVRNEVLIEAPNHKRRRRLSVLNTRAEHGRLIETLRAYGKPVICAFEATGNYHRPIAWRLIEAGFDVRLVLSSASLIICSRTMSGIRFQTRSGRGERSPKASGPPVRYRSYQR